MKSSADPHAVPDGATLPVPPPRLADRFGAGSLLPLARAAALFLSGTSVAMALMMFVLGDLRRAGLALMYAIVGGTTVVLARLGRERASLHVLVIGGWLATAFLTALINGLYSTLLASFAVFLISAGFALGPAASLWLTFVSGLMLVVLAGAHGFGWGYPIIMPIPPTLAATVYAVIFACAGALGYYASRVLREQIGHLGEAHEELLASHRQLQDREQALLLAQERIHSSGRRLRALFDSVLDPIVIQGADGKVLEVNAALCHALGYEEQELVGMPASALLGPDGVSAEAAPGEVSVTEQTIRRRDGSERQVQLHRMLLPDGNVQVVVQDLTLVRSNEKLVANIARGVVAATGADFFRSLCLNLLHALDADVVLVGEVVPPAKNAVRTLAICLRGNDAPNIEYPLLNSPFASALASGRTLTVPNGYAALYPEFGELGGLRFDGYVGTSLHSPEGEALGVLVALSCEPLGRPQLWTQVLEIFGIRVAAEIEHNRQIGTLERLALYDPLTGLPNRVRLMRQMEPGLAAITTRRGRAALMLIDLDRFKEVNDTLGHHVGDVLLQDVAQRLRTFARDGVVTQVARLGGDEFAIWAEGADRATADAAAHRIIEAITRPYEVQGYTLELGASIGIALVPEHADTPSGLLRCADVAMYAAKARGGGVGTYDLGKDPYTAERLGLLSELAGAGRRGELMLCFQPQVDLKTSRVRGFEALVRWVHPTLGLLPPSRFIPLAELSDVIRPLSLWVIEEALARQQAWRAQGWTPRIAVNLSARLLRDAGLPDDIAALLNRYGNVPGTFEFEITESALIGDPEQAEAMVRRLGQLGIQVAIDDFGTGYSSLSHLRRLPLNALKIDVSFVRQMRANEQDRIIVDSTIGLAHNLGLRVVAEGVEDELTLAALREFGCDEVQGFHVGRPMPWEVANEWMAGQTRWIVADGESGAADPAIPTRAAG